MNHLKRKIFLSILFSISISCVYSQSNFRYGVKAGTNYSVFIGPGKPDRAVTPWMFDFGGFAEYAISEWSSFWVEPGIIQRCAVINEQIPYIPDSKIVIKEKNNYLTVPTLFNIRQGDDFFSTFVAVGPEFELLVQKRRIMNARIGNLVVPPTYYHNFTPHRLSSGFTFMAGVKVMGFIATGKFYTSFQNLYKGENIREVRYNTFTISLLYQINRPSMRSFNNGRNASLKNKFRYTYIRIKKSLKF